MKRLLPMLALLSTLAAPVAATDTDVSRLRIRPRAVADREKVTLADVVDLAQADPVLLETIGMLELAPTVAARGKRVVSHAQIVRCLNDAGVNMGRVLVCGAARCEVVQPATSGSSTAAAPLLRERSSGPQRGARTLADLLREHINAELAELGGTAELQFDRAGQEYLALTTPPWDFKVTGIGPEQLGLREFRVLIRRDGRVQQTARVYAHVRLTCPVVIARRPLSLGNFIRHDDVDVVTRVFDSGQTIGLRTAGEAIGQQVKQYVPAGGMVTARDIKAVDLVRRSRPVTVVGAADNVHVRLTGVALDSAGYGESVRVRLGESRRSRQQVRGVVTGLGTVRLVEDQP